MSSTIAWILLAAIWPGQLLSSNLVSVEQSDVVLADSAECPADEGKDPGHCSRAHGFRPTVELPIVGGSPRGGSPGEAEEDTDVLNYFLEIELIPEYSGPDPVAVRVEGVSTIMVRSTVDGLATFTVDLHAPLTIHAITGNVASYVRDGDQVIVTLDQTYDTNEQFQISVDYSGYPSTAGFGAFAWWTRNGDLMIATLSEPYYARTWWACKDRLSDKSTMQMHCTVPNPLVVASNGIDEGTEAMSGGRTKYKWHTTSPMVAYLASLAVTTYRRYDLVYNYDAGFGPQAMPVVCYIYPDFWDNGLNQPNAPEKAGCDELPSMLATLGQAFGLYPFLGEKYGVAQTGGAGAGGSFASTSMEHQTISSMSQIANFSDIMAHELAHHWWGDNVTCGTWYDIWVNEGFASYSEAVYRELKPGGGISSYWSRMNARRPSGPDAMVYRTNINSVGGIFSTNSVYNKGAWVLHMLRHVMGDAMFFQALDDFRDSFEGGFATTSDFAGSISATFGHDLSWFTDQWVMSPGSPRYEWAITTATINGQVYLKLRIHQTQDSVGFGLITMPIDIRVTTGAGASVKKVWNNGWDEYYVLQLDGLPVAVEFDEDGGVNSRNWILSNTVMQVPGPVAGPPTILSTTINPFGTAPGETRVEVYFSENIGSFETADVTLTGATTGAHVPTSATYSAAQLKATIVFNGLPNDDYSLSVLDDAVTANGLALDGEIDNSAWYDPALYPSGDGQPGGDAVLAFVLLAGDSNCNGVVTLDDVDPFVAAALGTDVDSCHVLRSDMDNSGDVDGTDVQLFTDVLVGN